MNYHEKFILALNAKKKIQMHYHDDSGKELVRQKCIPLDYCEYKKENGKESGYCFRLWDCQKNEIISKEIKDENINSMEILEENFKDNDYKNDSGFCGTKCAIALFILLLVIVLIIAVIKFI